MCRERACQLERAVAVFGSRYAWLSEVATQGATFLFYVVTGIKFRPMRANPYLRISQEDEEELRELELQQIAMEQGSDDL